MHRMNAEPPSGLSVVDGLLTRSLENRWSLGPTTGGLRRDEVTLIHLGPSSTSLVGRFRCNTMVGSTHRKDVAKGRLCRSTP